MLQDRFGRVHDYLRLSLVDKCNLRCTYCMPENIRFLPNKHLLSDEELFAFAETFVEMGVKKIRFTGGEPLLRRNAGAIMERIARLPVQLALTTNGILLHEFTDLFGEIGLRNINVSLDTLQTERFAEITRRDQFQQVRENIERAGRAGFHLKINVVVTRGVNEDELLDFVALTASERIHVRFIEFMPFDGNRWKWDQVCSYREMMARIEDRYTVKKLQDGPNSTAKAYRVSGFAGTFAVISSVTQPFCGTCNRIRLTADGKLRNCLFATQETDLLTPFRTGEDIRPRIVEAIRGKAKELGGLPAFQDESALQQKLDGRAMVKIGG
ncbi:MAG: GTP 3',8-cyclase MoaA [Bacteroidota bacterium]